MYVFKCEQTVKLLGNHQKGQSLPIWSFLTVGFHHAVDEGKSTPWLIGKITCFYKNTPLVAHSSAPYK